MEKDQSAAVTQDVETGIIRGGKKQAKFFGILSPILLQAFTLTFLAEWGDRSQLATILLASREVCSLTGDVRFKFKSLHFVSEFILYRC